MNFTDYLFLFIKDLQLGHSNYPKELYWDVVKNEINKKIKQRKEKQKYYTTINRLIKYKFLIKKNKKGKETLEFTPKGIIKLQRCLWKKTKRIKLKNKEMCLVVFDIPEEKSRIRNLFRSCLYELGFELFQKSVFCSKYNVYKETKNLIDNCEINDYVKIMIVREIK